MKVMQNIKENTPSMTTVNTNPPQYPCNDRFIFSDPLSEAPVLLDVVRRTILRYVENIRAYLPVTGVKIVGQCLSMTHSPDCPVEVLIEVENASVFTTVAYETPKHFNAYKDLSLIQHTPIPTNPHTLTFTLCSSPEKQGDPGYKAYDDVYDVEHNAWVKHDSLKTDNEDKIMKADVEKFLNDLSRRVAVIDLKVQDVNNGLVDAEELEKRFKAKQLPELKKQLESRLAQIESDVKAIVRRYERLNKQRASEYKNADGKKLAELARKAELPDDVVYRLLERYYYVELSKKLNEVLNAGPVTADTVVDLKKIFTDFVNKQSSLGRK